MTSRARCTCAWCQKHVPPPSPKPLTEAEKERARIQRQLRRWAFLVRDTDRNASHYLLRAAEWIEAGKLGLTTGSSADP